MSGKVLNIKICSQLKLHHGLTGKCKAICHYSYNLALCFIMTNHYQMIKLFRQIRQNLLSSDKTRFFNEYIKN